MSKFSLTICLFTLSKVPYMKAIVQLQNHLILYLECHILVFFSHRKVQNETVTGSVSVNKVRTTLTVQVEGIEFDTQACMLRVKGRNIQENQYVKVQFQLTYILFLYLIAILYIYTKMRLK